MTNYLNSIKIEVKNNDCIPTYGSELSSGADLKANIENPILIPPGRKALIPTGVKIALPDHLEAQVRSRSGLAARSGVFVLNSPGTIDADYRGEIKVILQNSSDVYFKVMPLDRIAQLVIAPVVRANFKLGSVDNDTVRGEGGFGSTGITTNPGDVNNDGVVDEKDLSIVHKKYHEQKVSMKVKNLKGKHLSEEEKQEINNEISDDNDSQEALDSLIKETKGIAKPTKNKKDK